MIIEGDYDSEKWWGDVRVDGARLDPKPSQKIWNHSPDGFAWGYGGSGPAQLALAILLKAGFDEQQAIRFHQRFKAQFIATLPRESFKIDIDIMEWVKRIEPLTADRSPEVNES